MKKKTLTGLAALTLFDIASAHAQTPPPVINWTGFYVGIHAGYRWADVDVNFPFVGFPPINTDEFPPVVGAFPLGFQTVKTTPDSGIFGFQWGYNFQINATFLIGLEGDFSWGKGSSTRSFLITDPSWDGSGLYSIRTETTWSASLRGRVGMVQNDWLFFVTGGVAFLGMNIYGSGVLSANTNLICDVASEFCLPFTNTIGANGVFSASRTLTGWTVGAGIERLLAGGWLVRVEYLFADFGTVNFGAMGYGTSVVSCDGFFCSTTSGTLSGNLSARITTQILRFALSKKFP